MKLRRLFIMTASLVMTAALAVTTNAAFENKKDLGNGFSDVSENSWYYQSVKNAYEMGLVTGTGNSTFSPSSTLTVAEGITMAARVHAEYNGKTIKPNTSENWYDTYVEYAVDNGIIYGNQFDDYKREIKRFEMAEIFHDAMGKEYFEKINDVVFIPDVPIGAMYYDKLLNLYNAGVVMGSDEYGSFLPESSIKRSETAAIIERVAKKETRLNKTLSDFTSKNAYVLCYNSSMTGNKEGINSGWVLDNRGGIAKRELSISSLLGDVSTEYGSAFIREFNYIPAGKIVLETRFTGVGNGAYVEYRDIQEKTTYMLKIVDGKWCILQKEGKYKEICDVPEMGEVLLRAEIDLDTGKSKTVINGGAAVVGELLSDNIMSYRIGVDEKGTGSVSVSAVNMVVNYAMYEDYKLFGTEACYGWENVKNVSLSSGQLSFGTQASATKRFDEVDGKVCFETFFIAKTGYDFDMQIGKDTKISMINKKMYVNGVELYDVTQNMWYRLRAEIDKNTKIVTVYLNGRVVGKADVADFSPVDFVTISTKGYLVIDDTKVYALYEYNDYVPQPTHKADMDDYIVGMNICSLWRNGTHSGWACISAYEEPTPVLGYYDEGLPETADWEIKYMTEHGVDFQAFCWYNDVPNGPVKKPSNSAQLHDGYMYAKYSDYMKYCILFEAANCAHFNSAQFRNYIVPYWFENYFLDERYMTIDNRLVLPVFSAESLVAKDYFGSAEGVKKELDYLEQKAKEYGFDGMIYLCNGSPKYKMFEEMGFDGFYSYNWGSEGNKYNVNVAKNLQNSSTGTTYTVPTISVGFDSIPWHGERYGNLPTEDLGKALGWVKDTFLPKYSNKDDWTDRLVWLSTWNEYGEGTYIMPSGLNGFGYLDEVRGEMTHFEQVHEDVVPTPKQRERINHLYPQYATLLRRDGWYYYELTEQMKEQQPNNKLYINDVDILENCDDKYKIPPVVKDDRVYFPINLYTGLEHILGSVISYRRDAGTVKIEANNHVVVLEIGSNRYVVDGKLKDLGYTLETLDNLPMVDFTLLAKDLDYDVREKDGNTYIYTDTYESLWKISNDLKAGTWEFNNPYNDEGWFSTNMTLSTNNGTITMTSIGETPDPITSYNGTSFPEDFYTKQYKAIEMRCRFKYKNNTNNSCFYYITDYSSQWAEDKCLRLSHSTNDTCGEWVTLTYDLTNETNWLIAERLTGLRFDPFNGTGSMEIDYIRFIEDEDFVYVAPEDKKIEIRNGDAEDERLLFFYSSNADITRVEDKDNKGNHYWYVKTIQGNNYTYLRYAARFKENTKYKIEFCVKLLENNSLDQNEADSTSVHANFRYADKGALNDFDHIVQNCNVMKISQNDGWVHYEGNFTTNKIDSHQNSEFTIYLDPVEGVGFSFGVDNIVVTEVEIKE